MVSMSPWPLLVGLEIFLVMVGFLGMIKSGLNFLFWVSLFMLILTMGLWWRDVVREASFQGEHTVMVMEGLMYGMILFIMSEVFFFASFFWSFFHSSLSPAVELGMHWPPIGLITFSPFQIPLLNTIILLGSGISVTWAHQKLIVGGQAGLSLGLTCFLGLYFLVLQLFEYFYAGFEMSDSVYGSIFFVATGFHGFHVIVGTVFLFIMWLRDFNYHFSKIHHFGFEAAAWYWHFVDVVWLFLFSVVYWWGA
uniref:Cytochrome c oxidase subunit 3 n=1 Tax=Loxosceles similis TaxID=321804 RepID=A0A4P8VWR3_LOXSM|nr:cytochrome c oxidase subunit III [Loxosceles similis]QCS26173.1 cytochrome c oxidase subunit III [Loxosceles similis]